MQELLSRNARGVSGSASSSTAEHECSRHVRFAFDQGVHGGGWYGRECREGSWLNWIPGDEAWLMLPPVAGPAVLRFHVVATVVPESLDNVEVLVNEVPVTWCRRDDERGFEYEAFVGEDALPDGVGRRRGDVQGSVGRTP